MKKIWKWIERIALLIAIISGLKVIGIMNIFACLKTFWIQLTAWQFLLILSIMILLCSFIIFLVNLYQKTNDIINDFTTFKNDMKKWIGLFSYRDKYSDLKGKIKTYIREEFEKEKKSQPQNSAD
jgi:hypothetical protein